MAKGNFIEYVVSNNPNKYPNGGEQGGYYYELYDGSGQYAWKKGTGTITTYNKVRLSINYRENIAKILMIDNSDYLNPSLINENNFKDALDGIYDNSSPTYNAICEEGIPYQGLKFLKDSMGNLIWQTVVGTANGTVSLEITADGTRQLILNNFLEQNGIDFSLNCSSQKDLSCIDYNSFVVSNNSSKYPSSGKHTDGYYYEKIN